MKKKSVAKVFGTAVAVTIALSWMLIKKQR